MQIKDIDKIKKQITEYSPVVAVKEKRTTTHSKALMVSEFIRLVAEE